MHTFQIEGQKPYFVNHIERIHTPRLLVFQDRVERNINRMKTYLEEMAPGSGFRHLCTHVKTHKSSHIVQMMLEAGITSFKTSLNEVDLVARCGVKDIFVAYPLLTQDALQLATFINRYPTTKFFVQIGSLAHAEILRLVAESEGIGLDYFIDVDVGMHRTGIAPNRAFELYSHVSGWEGFTFVGLHGYDGHIHTPEAEDRLTEAERAMKSLLGVVDTFRQNEVSVPRIVVAGSPTFRIDLTFLYDKIGKDTWLQVSPGTWVYWDSGYDKLLPGAFEMAAVILAQVMEVGEKRRITLNLGHKRWGADQGPVELFSRPGLKVVSFNEEHTVLEVEGGETFEIGDYVLVVPKHVCSTVNLYEYFTLIREDGEIENVSEPVDARNR